MQENRDAQILGLRPIVLKISSILAGRIRNEGTYYNPEDLIQAGWVGAIKAVDSYDSSKSDIRHYAKLRIEGSILDFMRKCDFLSRSYRKDLKSRGVDISLLKPMSLDYEPDLNSPLKESIEDKRYTGLFMHLEAKLQLRVLLMATDLTKREVRIMREYYWNEKTHKQIAAQEKVTESRITQIVKTIVTKLKCSANIDL